ncbi:DUF6056 family protein [Ructibacterium gallinarum]|nr:DUF6056 family protein [Ructibacterium gallinarum]
MMKEKMCSFQQAVDQPLSEKKYWNMAYLVAAAVAIFTFLVMRNVRLYGDDYFYGTFGMQGWSGFWQAHQNHYMQSNGRAVVHILDALFLQFPPILWQVVNCFMLGLVVFLGVCCVLPENGRRPSQVFCGSAVLGALILYLDIRITNQSVYWETGSWNYVFPFVLLLGTWVMLEKRRRERGNSIALSILAFFSAATTEQNAMMTVGLIFLYLADSWWVHKKKVDRAMLCALCIAVLGALSVLAAPSQWTRFQDEQQGRAEMTFGELLVANVKEQGTLFFSGIYMQVPQIMAIAGTIFFVFTVSSRFWIVGNVCGKLWCLVGLCVIGLVLYASGEYDDIIAYRTFSCIFIFIYYLLSGIFLFWYMLTYKPEQYYIPLIAVILAAGSQLMMLVSPMFGPRTVLCAIFLMGIYTSFMVTHYLPFQKGKIETRGFMVLLCLVMMGNAVQLFLPTISGYKANAPIDAQNRMLIEQYKQQGGENLVQYTMRDDFYAWSLPYNSAYHEEWYKVYYELPAELPIVWENMSEET